MHNPTIARYHLKCKPPKEKKKNKQHKKPQNNYSSATPDKIRIHFQFLSPKVSETTRYFPCIPAVETVALHRWILKQLSSSLKYPAEDY